MKEKLSTQKKKSITVKTLTLSVVVSVLIYAGIRIYLAKLETGLLDVCAIQQDSYVEFVLEQIFLRDNRTDDEIMEMIAALDASNDNYWTLSKNKQLLFVKDVMETNRYKGITMNSYYASASATKFLDSLMLNTIRHDEIVIGNKEYIVSGTAFSYQGKEYKICLLTNKDVILDQNLFLEANINILTVVMFLCVFCILLSTGLSYKVDRQERIKNDLQVQLIDAEYRLSVKKQQEQEERKLEKRGRTKMKVTTYREYCLKFYLNARHYIIIQGIKGEVHPHTWEFALTIQIPHDTFVEFHVFEDVINNFLEQYQNKILNNEEMFLTVLPTLENMTDCFSNSFYHIIHQAGGTLLQVEASETPTRSYIVNMVMDEEGK